MAIPSSKKFYLSFWHKKETKVNIKYVKRFSIRKREFSKILILSSLKKNIHCIYVSSKFLESSICISLFYTVIAKYLSVGNKEQKCVFHSLESGKYKIKTPASLLFHLNVSSTEEEYYIFT